jgi:hypothetical protein
MELSSSRLENDGENESVFTQIRNENALTHIFGHIYAILNQIHSLPTSTVVELSSIDKLIHVITLK